jgi:haloalkane dehalogenase
MTIGATPFAEKKFIEVMDHKMAYMDVGEGAPIVFLHGNPTSSYLWRNVMPACRGLGRLIACDFIGMGDSDKLSNSGPTSYSYSGHRSFAFALWDKLDLGGNIVFVTHDWSTNLAIEWARQNTSRMQGLAYMESVMVPREWADLPEAAREIVRQIRSPDGEEMVLRGNLVVEKLLPKMIFRTLSDVEMEHYRKPFLNAGEDRRPTLASPREVPIAGEPADVFSVMAENAKWVSEVDLPKLYIHVEPGVIDQGRQREFCRNLPNQREVTVKGLHFAQEDSPDEIASAIADFIRDLRKDLG